MAVLLCPQNIACAPDLQIPHGNLDSASKLRKFPDCLKALFRLLPEELISPIHQKGVSGPVRAPHASPDLVKLRQAQPIRVVNDNRVGIGDI